MLKRMEELLLIILAFIILTISVGRSEAAGCIEKERQALLSFKHGLVDKGNFLSTWTKSSEDCCSWRGISCHTKTGRVIALDLHQDMDQYSDSKIIEGEIGSSLIELQYLRYLDLSYNNFARIPNIIGSFTSLNYLNLSYNDFIGTIPSQIGNLTNLRTLDLRNSIQTIATLHWLPQLSSLRTLRFDSTNFTEAVDWLQSIKLAPSLSSLELSNCVLPKVDTSLLSNTNFSNSLRDLFVTGYQINPTVVPWLLNISSNLVNLTLSIYDFDSKGFLPNDFPNITSLEYIDLSGNYIKGGLPKYLRNLCSLKVLLLSYNYLTGTLDDHFRNMSLCTRNSLEILDLSGNEIGGSIPEVDAFSSLQELYLANNHLEGPIPFSLSQIPMLAVLNLRHNLLTGLLPDLSKLSSLRELRVGHNKFNGSLPESIGQLSNLEVLDVSSNSFTGTVSKSYLQKLLKLKVLDLSFNSLTLNFDTNWTLPSVLSMIKLNSCKIGPRFPRWLQSQLNLSYIDIADAGIHDTIPYWFYDLMPSKLSYLNLSFNHINGTLQSFSSAFHEFPTIDLSFNLLEGTIPVSLSTAKFVNLSNNRFTRVRSFLCKVTIMLTFLDISHNMLAGPLPDCVIDWTELLVLNLENNNLSGNLSSSLSSLHHVQILRLRNNNFSGTIPLLQNSANLIFLDLGNNRLSGKIPAWNDQSLQYLEVLRLKSNKLNGSIPLELCSLPFLRILDLSLNNISGKIPPCIRNLSSMASYNIPENQNGIFSFGSGFGFGYESSYEMSSAYIALLMWKGTEYEFVKIPQQLRLIDVSCNALVGHIPRELVNLTGLVQLNFSRNSLRGDIPGKIGQLKWLESLDMSHNQLSGNIPSSLADISTLAVLDLSHNQLSGRIPKGTQLQSFDASAYEENRGLCGPPLTTMCPGDDQASNPLSGSCVGKCDGEDGELWFDTLWFYIGIGVGSNFGFWGVCGALLLNTSCRRAYFMFLSNFGSRLYMTVSSLWNKLAKKVLQN